MNWNPKKPADLGIHKLGTQVLDGWADHQRVINGGQCEPVAEGPGKTRPDTIRSEV